jgi:hypothetical protein
MEGEPAKKGRWVVMRNKEKGTLRGLLSNLEAELGGYLDEWRRELELRRRSEAAEWRGKPTQGSVQREQRRQH